jgi:NAD(P)-dependent dehydrogenase (short-subunit alcohol dehydrogenase family)
VDAAHNLSGKVCLVTGANRGIGYATSVALARAGAIVTLVGRNPARLRSARDVIRRTTGADRIDHLTADLASQAAIRSLSERFRARHDRLDVLVNNAATMSEQRQVTVDGRERTFAVNHLAYFLPTRLLLDLLVAAQGVIVNVAASRHRDAVEGIEDLDSLAGYEMRAAYIRSKLVNVSFTLELARRLGASAGDHGGARAGGRAGCTSRDPRPGRAGCTSDPQPGRAGCTSDPQPDLGTGPTSAPHSGSLLTCACESD